MAKDLIYYNGNVIKISKDDFISLTDMVKLFPGKIITEWLKSKQTLEFICTLESLENPNFDSNSMEIHIIKNDLSRVTVKKLAEANITVIRSSAGRYGDTKAHPDLAFKFAMWLDSKFELWVIREFRKMKDHERKSFFDKELSEFIRKQTALEYAHMCNALENMRVYEDKDTKFYHYTNEADMINKLVCGLSSKQCKELHGDTPRNIFKDKTEYFLELEKLNTGLIMQGISFDDRKKELQHMMIKLPVIIQKKESKRLLMSK